MDAQTFVWEFVAKEMLKLDNKIATP